MRRSATVQERDACAIIAFVDKRGRSTHANIVRTIDALKKMGHRSGDINGEGDGCGILVDIPRELWAKRLQQAGLNGPLVESRNFFIGHFLLPASIRSQSTQILALVRKILAEKQAEILLEVEGATRDEELGPRARTEAPLFWQIAGMTSEREYHEAQKQLFHIQLEIERQIPQIHIASLSGDSAVYKLRGMPHLLPRVYPDLFDEEARSVIALGHSRYSTNTLPTVERAQPFSLLGHNGEINTIERLRSTGRVLGIEPVPGGSDSQDLNRIVEGLIHVYGLDPLEALEMVFPTIHSEVAYYPEEMQRMYAFYRWFFPSSAQGPAAVVARYGDVCMGSVDALGLRPLWFGESDYDYFLSSEKGVVELERTLHDPRPLAPGEKIAIVSGRGRRAEVLDYSAFQRRLLRLMKTRKRALDSVRGLRRTADVMADASSKACAPVGVEDVVGAQDHPISTERLRNANMLAAFGWQKYDIEMTRRTALEGRDIIGSMGHQGPLAALMPEALPNVSEYFKENVAVVTNPAIDREREAEHFTTRVILGDRPDIDGDKYPGALGLELQSPLLLGGCPKDAQLDSEMMRAIARDYGTCLMEDVLGFFSVSNRDKNRIRVLDTTFAPQDGLRQRLEELAQEARQAVEGGSLLLLLDDSRAFTSGRVFVDPAVAVAHLIQGFEKLGLRRRCSLVVRSGAVRNLHDIMFLLGLGADAINPYLMWLMAVEPADEAHPAEKLLRVTMDIHQKGMEKVMSTMGIHELCGYGRIFASIGLSRELEEIFQIPNFCPSDGVGLTYGLMEEWARKRLERAEATEDLPVYSSPARNPKVGRALRAVAVGKKGYRDLADEMAKIDDENPVAIRHVLAPKFAPGDRRLTMDQVDISIGQHDMPIVIAAMSFGSQGENSFRAYVEAAKKVNIICMNGEGGEIPDMLGHYRKHRGQQIASGRFGVFMGLLNSANYLEIKIGQGAKPGEGGHLPGTKVSEMVAKARHCKPGITLISPSNQHDIYSIEDLAQIVTELKIANPFAKVSVKIPVTSGVGTIAVGVAKAGADIVNLSGFDGGTGAAREHAKRYVGLPAEIGVSEAHRALVESGLRDKVEIWCDGGMRSAADVLKMILLGANRVGVGTVALMGVGCISCQRCHLDTCPKGISTQMRTKADADAKGVKGFSPRNVEVEAENLARLLSATGEHLRSLLADLGERHLQSLVGRTDLLQQVKFADRIDAQGVLAPPAFPGLGDSEDSGPRNMCKSLNYLTRLISEMALEQFEKGTTLVRYTDEGVKSTDRAVGTFLAGAIVRKYGNNAEQKARLRLCSSVPGNGLCAFSIPNIEAFVEGGSQDGAAKGSFGGILGVFKGRNILGRTVDGSTGKSFAYGAIGGTLMIQNFADSRACVRMSGADVVFGGRITAPVRDEEGNLAVRSHLKGFAFEYMTGGRAVVLGDPGPWMCAGMTGGVIYQCLYPEYSFTVDSIKRRLARGANMEIVALDETGLKDLGQMLGLYIKELERHVQHEEAEAVSLLLRNAKERFVMLVPKALRPPSAG